MNVTVGAKTDPGRRANNEDQLAVVDVHRCRLRAESVLVIADGMGGRNFGERASAAAVETVQETLIDMLASSREAGVDIGEALASALRKANARVYDLASTDVANKGMGTTCVAAVIAGTHLAVAHVGDSRAYLLRGGQLERLTDDHSYVAEQVRAGAISEESARHSRFRNVITRAIGIEPSLAPEVADYEVRQGDSLLLCTDGLTNMVGDEEIAHLMTRASSAQNAADRLVQAANRSGGKDNITAIVARIGGEEAWAEEAWEPETSATKQKSGAAMPMARSSAVQTRRFNLGAFVFAALALLFFGAALFLGHKLIQAGYRFQPAAPFAVKPAPPVQPPPPDLAHVAYAAPVVFYFVPVRNGILTRSAADGSLTVVTLPGQIVRLAADGKTLYKYPLPATQTHSATSAMNSASYNQDALNGAEPLHFGTDRQGDLYVAEAAAHTIMKYSPNGDPLGLVARSTLKQPGAIAVADDGTIYVIDAERLKVIQAKPGTATMGQ